MKVKDTVVLFAGRDSFREDEHIYANILGALQAAGIRIVWEDPAIRIYRYCEQFEKRFSRLPRQIITVFRRSAKLLYAVLHGSFDFIRYNKKPQDVADRGENLKKRIASLAKKHDVIVLSRSAGGRVSSQVADEVAVKKLICISYPFCHPHHGDEPARYEHLASLKTPMLIIQGTRDEYGGTEVLERYALSPAVDLCFVDADHDFRITDEQFAEVVAQIRAAILSA